MKGNPSDSVKFLKEYDPEGPWVLTAISTDRKGIAGACFSPDQASQAEKWIAKYDGERNIYFHVNRTMGEIKRKAEKTQIKAGLWLHVDVDSQEGAEVGSELDRIHELLTTKLPKGIPEPTLIIFSGGGYQAFWRLSEPFVIDGDEEKWNQFESYNLHLEQVFSGDHCHNVDRIMRLPGTINVPDAKKRQKGRTEQLARVIEFNRKKYPLDKFKTASPVQNNTSAMGDRGNGSSANIDLTGSDRSIVDLSELDEWDVPERVKIIIAQGRDHRNPKKGDNSRSAWVFDAVCQLVRLGVPDGIIYSLLTDKDWGISESVLEQKDPHRYAIRQITNAHEQVVDPDLHYMNSRHAVIGNVGGKCRVIEEIPDDVMNRSRVTYSSFEDVRNRYGHIKVNVGEDANGKKILVPLGKYWLNHPQRAQFDYIKFMPNGAPSNVFNLWRGFAVAAAPGDCSMYLDHLKTNVCQGNEEYYNYLIKWMARAVQQPASQGEVAIVLRGGKGTGKSVTAMEFGKLFGRHALHISNPSHLVGNFNSHLKDTIMLFSDEAFFAGDKKHESVLKMLVTEDSIPIEAKHVDVEPFPNYVHLIMASNDMHVIRATGDERRFFVLEVGNRNQQDLSFFGDMKKQMENGGREALLYLLKTIDISDFQVRKVPQTSALKDQKLLSMSTDEEWWYRKLRDGRILESDSDWTGVISCERLISDFVSYAERWKVTRRGNETALGRFLKRVTPHVRRYQTMQTIDDMDSDGRQYRKKARVYVYDFGSLTECRKSWERIQGSMDWEEIHQEDLPDIPKEPF